MADPSNRDVLRARALVGVATRNGGDVVEAQRALAAAKLAAYVERTVAAAPDLTPEQRDFIAGVLRSTRGQGAA